MSDEEQEIVSAKITDRRRFKEEEILIREDRMSTFKRGIINFIMGGCILNRNGKKQKYAYVIHTAVAQQAHDRVANITKTLIYQLKEKAEEHIVYIEKLLQESYRDISIDMPTLTLLHQNGVAEGWKGREFWWPILTLSKNTPKTIFALPNVDVRIRKR